MMTYFDWNDEKNVQLRKERGISFEDVLVAIDEEKLITVIDHPNQKKYKGQKIMIVDIASYAYLVPYVIRGDVYFLKTIIPSRKATKEFIVKRKENI